VKAVWNQIYSVLLCSILQKTKTHWSKHVQNQEFQQIFVKWSLLIVFSAVLTVCFKLFFRQPQLLKGVYAMGFNAPSKIQETALPTLLADP
jgi:superfamily II DNA/RNA helicase